MATQFVTHPQWDIFQPDEVDLSTTEKEWVEYREINVITSNTNTRLEIETRDKDAFILPHEGYLEVRFKIAQDVAGTAIPGTDMIALQNNALSLFKDVSYYIEDQVIETCDEPAIAHTIVNLSTFSKPYGESVASKQMFYLDKEELPNPLGKVRFVNNTAPRVGVELQIQENTVHIRVVGAAAPALWQDGDEVIAFVGNKPVVFTTSALATFGDKSIRTVTLNATGDFVSSGGANTDIFQAHVLGGGPVDFYRQGVLVQPVVAAGLVVNWPAGGNNGDTGAAFARSGVPIEGFLARQQRCARSQEVSAWIPFKNMFLFCRAYDKISRGLRHRIILNRNVDGQCLIRFGGADRVVLFTHISAWIPRLKPNLETLKKIEANLTSNNVYTVNFTDLTLIKTPPFADANTPSGAFQLATTSKKPIRVWVAFQKETRVGNSQTVNKRVFDHLNTRTIQVRLNGRIFPLYEYKFDANFTNYTRAYTAFISANGRVDYDDSSLITYEMYKELYPIFYFDLTNQEEDLYKANKMAELEVRWSNEAGGMGQYRMYVIHESERVIQFRGVNGSLALQM